VCSDCRATVWLSARRARRWRACDYVCRDCRMLNAPLTDEERARYLAWWRDTYSPRELESIGRALSSLSN